MGIRHIITALAALAITVSSAALADDIYKWIDADGELHYEDRPSGDPSEERLQFSYNRTNNTSVRDRVETRRDTTNARREAKAEAEEEKRTAADSRAAAEQKLAQCTAYRAKLKSMLEARRVYRQDDAGERVYLDEAARSAARSKAEELIKETCGN